LFAAAAVAIVMMAPACGSGAGGSTSSPNLDLLRQQLSFQPKLPGPLPSEFQLETTPWVGDPPALAGGLDYKLPGGILNVTEWVDSFSEAPDFGPTRTVGGYLTVNSGVWNQYGDGLLYRRYPDGVSVEVLTGGEVSVATLRTFVAAMPPG
jgi:hypothetical protein